MIHVLGAITILCCSAIIGVLNVVERQRQIKCLQQICTSLAILRGELEAKCQPLPDVFRELCSRSGRETFRFFSFVSAGFALLEERSFFEIWQEGVLTCLSQLSREEKNELIPLGSVLGRYDLPHQSAAIQRAISRLQEELDRQEKVCQKEKKLYLGIPTAMGILLIIMLL